MKVSVIITGCQLPGREKSNHVISLDQKVNRHKGQEEGEALGITITVSDKSITPSSGTKERVVIPWQCLEKRKPIPMPMKGKG